MGQAVTSPGDILTGPPWRDVVRMFGSTLIVTADAMEDMKDAKTNDEVDRLVRALQNGMKTDQDERFPIVIYTSG
jgi:hypothetical protein